MITTLKTLVAAIAAIFLVSTAGAEEMSTNKESLKANFYDVLGGGQLELLDNVLVENWISHDPNPGQEQGRDGLKKFLPSIVASFSDFKWTVEEMIEEGNVVVVRSTFSGTHAGDFMGKAATGKPFTAKAIDVHHFNEEGMVTHTYHLEDWLAVLAQIGALGQ